MLSIDDNELICRTGPGTPMGRLMREYWIPCMLSEELPRSASDPVRVLLLGEQLIAFRDATGAVGLLQNHCPHRGASLFFGRNEDNESGLRCVYHGWKFDVDGNCIDMPNEPAESDFRTKVKAVAYPTRERGGVVWAYLGPRDTPPPLPDIEGNMVANAAPTAVQHACNWLQVGEGAIDTSHAGFLHFGSLQADDYPKGTFSRFLLETRAPRYAVVQTDAGVTYGAYRDAEPGYEFWRIAHFLLPFYTMNPQGLLGAGPQGWQARVPMDDTHMLSIGFGVAAPEDAERTRGGGGPGRQLLPNTRDWYGRFRQMSGLENDFLIDRDLQRSNRGPNGFTGIQGVGRQDQAMTTSMGAIYDRSREHLGTSDAMVIQVRRRLLQEVKTFVDSGGEVPGVDRPEAYRLRSGSVFLPKSTDWLAATADLRRAFVDHPDLDRAPLAGGLSG